MFYNEIIPLSDSLYRMAYSILRDPDEAHDAVQELLLNLWEKRNELGNVRNLRAFIFRSMRNKSLDLLRKRKYNSNELSLHLIDENNPYKQTEQRDLVERVQIIIDKLPELQRTIIQMRDVEGMEIKEISEITEITENAVRVNLSRARQRVRNQLVKETKL